MAWCVDVSENNEKVAAVVVTYNRKLLLEECLDSLLAQSRPLDAIFVVDNHSSDGTPDHLLSRDLIEPPADSRETVETVRVVPVPCSPDRRAAIHYVRLPENTGGAGGFQEGMKRAIDAGFDWLWLMDDDLLTAPDALETLVEKKRRLQTVREGLLLLNSLVVERGQPDGDRLAFPMQELAASGSPRMGVYHRRLSEIRPLVRDGLYNWVCPFNGTFVPAVLTKEIGLPDREFFIWGDEKDFLWRAAKRCSLYTVVDSRVYHPASRESAFDWRQYYNIRNMIVLNNRYFRHRRLRNLKLIVTSLVRGLRHRPDGPALVLRAIRDGLAGRLGKRDDLNP